MSKSSWYLVIGTVLFLLLGMGIAYLFSSSDGSDDAPIESEAFTLEDFNYATIEYRDDLLSANTYFLEVKAYPGKPFPRITGEWVGTNVHVPIQLRGVAVPRALQTVDTRNRPHPYIQRERQRFDASMDYIWSLLKLNKTLKVGNPEVVGDAVECDILVLLGGNWQNLAMLLLGDEHFRPIQADGSEWDFGSLNVSLLNPNILK